MNYREIIGPDELDWKVILLDWKKIGKEELKMGTPMSKDGVEANDASCYGILMDDVQKDKHFQARVIVSGCVDFAKAEEYSGIKISAEAKKAIGNVWSQGGGGLTELPEPQTVTFTVNAAGTGYIASHTGAEIAEMAKRGTVVGKFETDGMRLLLRYIGGMNGNACFVSGSASDNGGTIYVFDVAADGTSINMGAISS